MLEEIGKEVFGRQKSGANVNTFVLFIIHFWSEPIIVVELYVGIAA